MSPLQLKQKWHRWLEPSPSSSCWVLCSSRWTISALASLISALALQINITPPGCKVAAGKKEKKQERRPRPVLGKLLAQVGSLAVLPPSLPQTNGPTGKSNRLQDPSPRLVLNGYHRLLATAKNSRPGSFSVLCLFAFVAWCFFWFRFRRFSSGFAGFFGSLPCSGSVVSHSGFFLFCLPLPRKSTSATAKTPPKDRRRKTSAVWPSNPTSRTSMPPTDFRWIYLGDSIQSSPRNGRGFHVARPFGRACMMADRLRQGMHAPFSARRKWRASVRPYYRTPVTRKGLPQSWSRSSLQLVLHSLRDTGKKQNQHIAMEMVIPFAEVSWEKQLPVVIDSLKTNRGKYA